jgi:hypothetical protein
MNSEREANYARNDVAVTGIMGGVGMIIHERRGLIIPQAQLDAISASVPDSAKAANVLREEALEQYSRGVRHAEAWRNGLAVAGVLGANMVLDQTIFRGTDTSLRTVGIDAVAAASVFATRLTPLTKVASVVGIHSAARIMDMTK